MLNTAFEFLVTHQAADIDFIDGGIEKHDFLRQ